MKWHKFYGGYARSGPFFNVVLIGDSAKNSQFNTPLTQAHQAGYGRGIGFESDNYDVTMKLDLVAVSINDREQAILNTGSYVVGSGTYNWIFRIDISKDGGSSFQVFQSPKIIFRHPDTYTMIYSRRGERNPSDASGGFNKFDWTNTAANCQYSQKFTLPKDTTHVRFTLMGENNAFPYSVTYPIEIIIPDFRPMSIRKKGEYYSLDTDKGFLRIRKSNNFRDIPLISYSDVNQLNKGSSRIRKNSQWRSQSRIGK